MVHERWTTGRGKTLPNHHRHEPHVHGVDVHMCTILDICPVCKLLRFTTANTFAINSLQPAAMNFDSSILQNKYTALVALERKISGFVKVFMQRC